MTEDTAERVKRAPYRWEQNLLNAARGAGQTAVDRMAERIARHNDAVKRLHVEARDASWQRKFQIYETIDGMCRALYAGMSPVDQSSD